jgi:hypothetical protein
MKKELPAPGLFARERGGGGERPVNAPGDEFMMRDTGVVPVAGWRRSITNAK